MITSRYLSSVKNVPTILQKITEGTAPDKFTNAHLKGLGFKTSADSAIIPLLKDLGFLSPDGTPTQRYHDYRNRAQSKAVMAEALREAYSDIFHINERPSENEREAIEGKFKSAHNVGDRVAQLQAMTFFALLKQADVDAKPPKPQFTKEMEQDRNGEQGKSTRDARGIPGYSGLRYNIEIHLPATKDIDVFNAIFKSLKENLLED